MKRLLLPVFLLLSLAFAAAACGGSSESSSSVHKKHYSQIYTSSDGSIYARSDDSGDDGSDVIELIWYMLYLNNQPATVSGISLSGTNPNLSGTSWRTPSNPPSASSLDKTDKVVETNEQGEPTESVADETEVDAESITDADTTNEEAQAEAEAEAADDSSSDDSSADDNSGDSGGDGGGDTGGDSGGGDAGGGDAGGGGGE